MELAIVIVNYRTPDDTVACLRSLAPELADSPGTRVVVVENGSADRSLETINRAIVERDWQWVQVMALPANVGFAEGNNVALREVFRWETPPRYILLLNPDTMVRRGAVRTMRQFLDDHPHVGIVGSRLEDPDGTPQRSAFRFPTVMSEFEAGMRLGLVSKLLSRWISAPPVRDDAHQIDWVPGASMMVRRPLFDQVGVFDPRFFMYYEEVDFCSRARRAGWSCWYLPQARVVHLVGKSSGVTDTRIKPRRRPDYWWDSRRLYFVKNRGWFRAAMADIAFGIGFATWRVRRRIQRKPDNDPPHMLWDFLRHSIWIKGARA